MKRFIIADTHFSHKNIISYCGRPFSSVEEMNDTLISNWNNVVSEDDLVYHLGDFSMSLPQEKVKELVSSLHGRIILIQGNHDTKPNRWYIECGFTNAVRKPIVVDDNVILSHEPPKTEFIVPQYRFIYGHIHDKPCEADSFPNCRCVSVERINYTPINFDKILKELKI